MNKKIMVFAFLGVAAYISTHLYGLTALPVFADEAIYIRWSQLILDDWKQYLFFPLNDGKTPLQMWLQLPFLKVLSDQLFAARLLSVLVGLGQTVVLYRMTRLFGGSKLAGWLAALFVAILPYWYFHHRMALIDGLLTFWLSITVLALGKLFSFVRSEKLQQSIIQQWIRMLKNTRYFIWLVVAGGSFGASLWTKLPAVLLIPVLLMLSIVTAKDKKQVVAQFSLAVATIVTGYAVFFTLSLHPAFPQLFSRGSDFLHPISGLFDAQVLVQTLPSIPNYINYFVQYATLPFWICIGIGLFYGKHKRQVHILFWSGIIFLLPILILGRVVYPRYLLPAMVFFTPAAALSISALFKWVQESQLRKSVTLVTVAVAVLVANIGNFSARFMIPALFSPNAIPFVSADAEQYLLEWSSGHGIAETAEMIVVASTDKKIAVATEGYFGTLPDGLLLYFHNKNVENIFIEGIGQPVSEIPDAFIEKTKDFDERWLVVNSHRLAMEDPGIMLAEFCRPQAAPCLQVWNLTLTE